MSVESKANLDDNDDDFALIYRIYPLKKPVDIDSGVTLFVADNQLSQSQHI